MPVSITATITELEPRSLSQASVKCALTNPHWRFISGGSGEKAGSFTTVADATILWIGWFVLAAEENVSAAAESVLAEAEGAAKKRLCAKKPEINKMLNE